MGPTAGPSALAEAEAASKDGVGTIYQDIEAAAAQIATELGDHGYRLDFSLASLAEVDRFFDQNSALDPDEGDSLLAGHLGPWLFALGAYAGEVVRGQIGGHWHWAGADDDPEAATETELVLVDGSLIFPLQKVWKRLMYGGDEAMVAWGRDMVAAVAPPN